MCKYDQLNFAHVIKFDKYAKHTIICFLHDKTVLTNGESPPSNNLIFRLTGN